MSDELKPCPFCGGDANAEPESQHMPDCYFDLLARLKAAPKSDLSLVPAVIKAWNRRAHPAEAEGVRDYLTEFAEGEVEAKTAIEELSAALSAVTAERDGLASARMAYANEFAPDENGDPDVGSVHANIRALKAERDQLRAEVEALRKDKARLDAIEQECWDVRFLSSPNGDAGDSSISIEIVGHFMAEPCERVVGENYNENLRAALDQAMTAEAYPPARPEYDEYGCPVRAAMAAKEV